MSEQQPQTNPCPQCGQELGDAWVCQHCGHVATTHFVGGAAFALVGVAVAIVATIALLPAKSGGRIAALAGVNLVCGGAGLIFIVAVLSQARKGMQLLRQLSDRSSNKALIKAIGWAMGLFVVGAIVSAGIGLQVTGRVVWSLPTPTVIVPSTPAPLPTLPAPQVPKVEPPPVQATGWQGVALRTLCLEAKDTYGELSDAFPMTISEITRAILEDMGFELVDPGQVCDATLTIEIAIEPLGARYQDQLNPLATFTCYGGANAEGTITLGTTDRAHELTRTFGESTPLPDTVAKCEGVEGAPYERWQYGYLDALESIWGSKVVIAALAVGGSTDPDHRYPTISDKVRKQGLPGVHHDASMRADSIEIDESMLPWLLRAFDRVKNSRMMTWLGDMGPAAADAVPHLAAFLEDRCSQHRGSSGTWYVYVNAIRALGSIGQEADAATPAIMCFVNAHGDWRTPTGYDTVRDVVDEVLPQLGPGTIPYLIDMLHARESQESVCLASEMLTLLAENGYRRETLSAVPYLIVTFYESGTWPRPPNTPLTESAISALHALRTITGQQELVEPVEFQKWWTEQQ